MQVLKCISLLVIMISGPMVILKKNVGLSCIVSLLQPRFMEKCFFLLMVMD